MVGVPFLDGFGLGLFGFGCLRWSMLRFWGLAVYWGCACFILGVFDFFVHCLRGGAGSSPGSEIPFCLRTKRNQKCALNTHGGTLYALRAPFRQPP